MRYDTRYIMSQLARGKPLPQGRPEDHLRRAIQMLDQHGVEKALRMGARPGPGTMGLLLDSLEIMPRDGGRKAVWCLRALSRGTVPQIPPLALGKHLERAGMGMPTHPGDQMTWWQLWERIARARPQAWTAQGVNGTTALDIWVENAAPALKKVIGSRLPAAKEGANKPDDGPTCHSHKNRP